MIKVLHVVSYLGSGGVETFLYNHYNNMNSANIQFDFIVHGDSKGLYEEKFAEMGSTIYHVTPRKSNLFKNVKQIKNIIKSNYYDIIHVHIEKMAFIPLYFANKKGISTRISHAHLSNQTTQNIYTRVLNPFFKKLSIIYATHYWGCSYDAIDSLFGAKIAQTRANVIKNAIDIQRFQFNDEKRRVMRQKLGVEDKYVLGHIGAFIHQKNHEFLIDVFREAKKNHDDYKLILVGEGPLERDIKKKVKDYGLCEDVLFLGVRDDIDSLMCSFDAFIFPSNYEGLGIVLIEAQASSLPCLTSDGVVPQEAKVTKNIEYVSLKEAPINWAFRIETLRKNYQRKNEIKNVRNQGYDVNVQAKNLETFYLKRVEKYYGNQ